MARALWCDLSLGAWSPRHAARELAGQLDIDLAPSSSAEDAEGAGDGLISTNVDREARGDGTLLAAYDDARRIAAACAPDHIVRVVRPRFGLPSRRDNRALLRFLRGFGVPVALHRPHMASVPLPPIVQLYPGIIDRALLVRLGLDTDEPHPALTMLAGGRVLVDPGARGLDPRRSAPVIDRLSRFERIDTRLYAYCQVMGSPLFVEATKLATHARSIVQDAADLALDLAAHARVCARTLIDQAATELALQGIRIFLHRFAEAAAAPEPSTRLPAAMRADLLTLRGWGRVMTGDLTEAERCFAADATGGAGNDALYRRNIVALARHRGGQSDRAMAMELEIASTLAAGPDPDPPLVFVNAINLSRLYRACGDADRASGWLARAFATSDGVRSVSEMMQLNLLLARAATDDRTRRLAQLRATFAWLAVEPPEALGIRAIRVVLGSDETPPRALDRRVSQALDALLLAGWRDMAPLSLTDVPPVATSDAAQGMAITASASTYGVALLWSPDRIPRQTRSVATQALARRAFAILTAETGTPLLSAAGTWIIDGATSCDVRAAPGDIRASLWRHGLADIRPALVPGRAVRRCEANGDGMTIVFKRHLPPLALDPLESAVVRAVADGDDVGSDALVRSLVDRRVLGFGDAA